ncbi:MAG: hypothetical protein HQL52_17780 [Magnetococcales bacterium]|nr:hypothetical protein [Magnetococcales bacterium]
MGGFGSGGHNNQGYGTVEDTIHLHVKDFGRQDGMAIGMKGTITWGQKCAVLFYRKAEDLLMLAYRIQSAHGKFTDVKQSIRIVGFPRHLGGQERYFICPVIGCGRRVEKLYIPQGSFGCRHCFRLSYRSQRERGINRISSKMDKLRMSLGDYLFKPPYMRWERYERLINELSDLEKQGDRIMEAAMDRMMKRVGPFEGIF